MNKARKQKIREAIKHIDCGTNILTDVLDQETDIMNNWPENLQSTDRYEKCEDAVDGLETATSLLRDALPYLEDIIM
nr:MAG TPA: hypothetical protein [Caudoviricetes sp.]